MTDDGAGAHLLAAFENRRLAAADFSHRRHVEVAYEMLGRYSFMDACARYESGVQAIATAAGVPEKYNATITIAFMSLVAERRGLAPHQGFDEFLIAHPDLMDRDLISRWYTPKRLGSPEARVQFLLPDRFASTD